MRKWIRISSAGLFFLFIFGCAAMEGRISNQALKLATTKADTLAARDSNRIINLPGDITPSYVQKYVVKRLAAGDMVGAQRAFRILCREGFEGYARNTNWTTSSFAWQLQLKDAANKPSFYLLSSIFDTLDGTAWFYQLSDTTAALLLRKSNDTFVLQGLQGVVVDTILTSASIHADWYEAGNDHIRRLGTTPFVCKFFLTTVEVYARSGGYLGEMEKSLYFKPGEVKDPPSGKPDDGAQ